jgi:hypothetical protein
VTLQVEQGFGSSAFATGFGAGFAAFFWGV